MVESKKQQLYMLNAKVWSSMLEMQLLSNGIDSVGLRQEILDIRIVWRTKVELELAGI